MEDENGHNKKNVSCFANKNFDITFFIKRTFAILRNKLAGEKN